MNVVRTNYARVEGLNTGGESTLVIRSLQEHGGQNATLPLPDGILLAQLRAATGERHARLESLPALQRLFASDYTITEYTRLLQSFFSLFGPLEAAVMATGRNTTVCLGYALRSDDLAADLQTLAADAVAATPVPSILTSSRPAEIGCLYVLEGSRLGGKVIARQLAGSLGLTKDSGMRFFAGSTGNEGHNWAQFCRRAEWLCDTPPAREAAVTAAAATFDLFYEQLADE